MTHPTPVGDFTAADLARWASNPYNERHEHNGATVTLVEGDLENHREVIRFYDAVVGPDGQEVGTHRRAAVAALDLAVPLRPAIIVEVRGSDGWEHFQAIETDTGADLDAAAGIIYLAIEYANEAISLHATRNAR